MATKKAPVKKGDTLSRWCSACGKRVARGGTKRSGYTYHKKCAGGKYEARVARTLR